MPLRGRGISVARRAVGKATTANISEELRSIRTGGTPPVLQRAVVIEVISDPFSLTEEYLDNLSNTVSNPEIIDIMPIGSIVAKLVNSNQGLDGSQNIILFPVFSSHFLMPINPGETVFVIFENYETTGAKMGFWLSRIHAQRSVEDINYTHLDRVFSGILNPGNYSTSERGNRPADSPVPDFPNGAGTSDTVTLQPTEDNPDPYDNIIANSTTYPLITPEAVPRWIKRPQEFVLQGANNALLVLGEDRNGSILGASGSNPIDIKGRSGTVDIVVGRGRYQSDPDTNPGDSDTSPTSCRTIVNSRNNLENNKAPFITNQNNTENINEGNPNPITDAARIYITQQSNVDLNYLLDGTSEDVQKYPSDAIPPVQPTATGPEEQYNRSYVVSKADHIRIIARTDTDREIKGTVLIIKQGKETGGGVGDAPASDEDLAYIYINEEGKIQIDGNRIYLGRTAGDGEQPYIKYTEFESIVNALKEQIKNLADQVKDITQQYNNAFTAATAIPYSPIASLSSIGPVVFQTTTQKITQIKSDIDNIDPESVKSKKIFGE